MEVTPDSLDIFNKSRPSEKVSDIDDDAQKPPLMHS